MTQKQMSGSSRAGTSEKIKLLMATAERASLYAVWAGGAMIIFSAFLVTFDVLARKFFGWSMAGSDEISGYTFGVSTTWALSFTLMHRAHVRVDALYLHFAPPVRAVLDVVSVLALGAFVTIVAWYAWGVFFGSWERDARSISPMQTPIWIPQFLWFVGLLTFVVTFVLMMVSTLAALVAGDLPRVRQLVGMRTVEEDVKEELAGSEALARKEG